MTLEVYSQHLIASLSKAGLSPGSTPLIPKKFKLRTKLDVKYGERALAFGELFRASECKVAPALSFASEADATRSYTLVLVDPDAPTPEDPKFAYWRHWVLPGLHSSTGPALALQPALTEYLGPGPRDESSPHRYLFLLYREPEGFALTKGDVGGEKFTDRRSFKADEWARKHGLELVSINWMRCAGDGWKP